MLVMGLLSMALHIKKAQHGERFVKAQSSLARNANLFLIDKVCKELTD